MDEEKKCTLILLDLKVTANLYLYNFLGDVNEVDLYEIG